MGRKFSAVLLGILVMGGVVAAARALEAQERSDDNEPSRISVFSFGGSYLGVHIEDVDKEAVRELDLPGEYGVRIMGVEEDTPAARAGLEVDDVLVAWNGERLRSTAQLRRMLNETPSGRSVDLELIRDGGSRTIEVELGESRGGNAFSFRTAPRGNFGVARPEILREHLGRIRERSPGARAFSFFSSGGRLGASIQNLGDQLGDYFGLGDRDGVLVTSVSEESAAEKGGLLAGDVILGVDGQNIDGPQELLRAIREAEAGSLELNILREKRERSITVDLPEREEGGRMWRRTAPSGAQSFFFNGDDMDFGDFEVTIPDLESVFEQIEGLGEVFERAFDDASIRWDSPENVAPAPQRTRSVVSA
ncbi:MAG: PDZ domain-containing protein [Gemmatimonadota bacterium]